MEDDGATKTEAVDATLRAERILPLVIAVDGPAASGKGTLARKIAERFGLAYLDTGTLYRAVARDALADKTDLEDGSALRQVAEAVDASTLDDPDLRTQGVGNAASKVARHGEVRDALLEFQRIFAEQPRGAVLDGRDIGTIVCPDADVKLYITADTEERARRRYNELSRLRADLTMEQMHADIVKRDDRDMNRAAAPLRPADDAYLLDTTDLDIESAYQAAVRIVEAAVR